MKIKRQYVLSTHAGTLTNCTYHENWIQTDGTEKDFYRIQKDLGMSASVMTSILSPGP